MKKLTIALSVCFLAACGTTDKNPETKPELAKEAKSQPSSSIEAKQLAAENEAAQVAEISFAKGKTELTPEATKRLREAFTKAKVSGKVEEVTVISWADQEYPSVHSENLPKAQQKLATGRGDAVTNFVKKIGDDVDVKTYSMAERPNALERLVSSSDARLKRSLETAGIPNTDTSVKAPSKASKAIVLFTTEDAD